MAPYPEFLGNIHTLMVYLLFFPTKIIFKIFKTNNQKANTIKRETRISNEHFPFDKGYL